MIRVPLDPQPEDTDVAADLAAAEALQDRLRRDQQTARALRAYLVEHPPTDQTRAPRPLKIE